MRTVIPNMINVLMIVYASRTFLHLKVKEKYYWMTCVLVILGRIVFAVQSEAHINLIVSVFLFGVLVIPFFEEKVIYKVGFIVSFAVMFGLCELITFRIFSLIFNEKLMIDDNLFFLGVFVSNSILILLIKITSIIIKNSIISQLPKYSIAVLVLPITSFFLLIGINDYYEVAKGSFMFIAITFGILASNILNIYIFNKIITNLLKERKLKEEINEANYKYETVQKELKNHEKILHDIRTQSIKMTHLLDEKKYIELREYIQEIYKDTINQYNMIHSEYELVDALINDRLYILKNNNIQVRTTIESKDFSDCTILELGELFGYFIDLAIHECLMSKRDNKYLLIRSKKIGEQTVLSFVFTSLSDIKLKEKEIVGKFKDFMDRRDILYLFDNNKGKENVATFVFLDTGPDEYEYI